MGTNKKSTWNALSILTNHPAATTFLGSAPVSGAGDDVPPSRTPRKSSSSRGRPHTGGQAATHTFATANPSRGETRMLPAGRREGGFPPPLVRRSLGEGEKKS